MDFQRVVLFGALALTLMMIWKAWEDDYGPKTQQVVTQNQSQPGMPVNQDTPGAPSDAQAGSTPVVQAMATGQRIEVVTDNYVAEIDTKGGDLRKVELVKYPVTVNKPDEPFTLLDDSATTLFVAQSGLLSAAGSGSPAPNHHAIFQAQKSEFRMEEGKDELAVPLVWQSEDGTVTVTKTYHFTRGSYQIDVDFTVDNRSGQPWKGHMYRQWLRNQPESSGAFGVHTYTGGVIYSQEEKYEKIDFKAMEKANLSRNITGGWAAMIQHYFLGAWIPEANEVNNYYSKVPESGRYILGMVGAEKTVAPGTQGSMDGRLYVGPKLQEHLAKVAPGLDLTVDYGMLTIISKPLFIALEFIHGIVGNWGWAIIFLTILIKAAFYKLSETSYKSMAHMRKVTPRLQALKERYADDKDQLNQAMMKIYKEEKINPLGGCLPILVQIPVFIALYWMLLETVEMRQAPFMLWIKDLSTADPYYVLPVMMGISMFVQQRLNPTPLDPIQARVMMLLPLIFSVFFAFFPSGLVLYWVVNNILSISQQWYITRIVISEK